MGRPSGRPFFLDGGKMPLLGDLFKDLTARHVKASEVNDLKTIEGLIPEFENLLNYAPGDLAITFALATVQMQCGRNGTAIALYKQILADKPDLPEVWNNLGSAWKSENRDEEAIKCWEKALSLKAHPDYYNNMITLYINTGMPEKGMPWAEKGLELMPDHPRMHWNYSLLLLEQGRWREGFENYEYGIESFDRPKRAYTRDPDALPWWNGEPGKRVVIFGEQGMGDEVMFASALPDAIRDAKEVVFDCHPRMVDLFKRSFGVRCFGTRKSNNVSWALNEKLDARCAIGSLFRIYRSDGNFPKRPYLVPDAKLVKKYRKRLEETGPGPYIGIGWRAGSKSTREDFRSLKLAQLQGMIEEGGTFISLQYNGEGGKCERFFEQTGNRIHHWPEVVESNSKKTDRKGEVIRNIGFNYDHTVALIQALDLCILPNTTAVHVCGALGQECWTLTPKEAAWRYQLSGDEMPFYRSVRQFRGEDAIERITEEYKERLHSGAWAKPAAKKAG
jgi:tetratricopeptide (TPR) repeat protein